MFWEKLPWFYWQFIQCKNEMNYQKGKTVLQIKKQKLHPSGVIYEGIYTYQGS